MLAPAAPALNLSVTSKDMVKEKRSIEAASKAKPTKPKKSESELAGLPTCPPSADSSLPLQLLQRRRLRLLPLLLLPKRGRRLLILGQSWSNGLIVSSLHRAFAFAFALSSLSFVDDVASILLDMEDFQSVPAVGRFMARFGEPKTGKYAAHAFRAFQLVRSLLPRPHSHCADPSHRIDQEE